MRNIIALFALTLGIIGSSTAQSYKTDVSLREQIINNSVPGAVYRDATTTTNKSTSTPQKSSGMLIKENAVPGVKYKTANTSAKSNSSDDSNTEAKVVSDKKAEKLQPQKLPEAPQLTQ